MIDWQLVVGYVIAFLGVWICRRYARRLSRENLFSRGGPHRAGLIMALSAVLIPVLVFLPVIFFNLFNLRLVSLAFLLEILACISIPLLLGGYALGRHGYNVHSPAEVQRLNQAFEPRRSHR